MIGTSQLSDIDYASGEDKRAQQALADHGFDDPATENVLVQLPAATGTATGTNPADDPRVQAAVSDLVAALGATGVTADVTTPFDVDGATTEPGQISTDGRSVMVGFDLTGDDDSAEENVEATLDAVAGVAAAHPDLLVEQFGNASANKALGETIGEDFKRAELLAIPLTLGILLAVFGAVVAALIPVALALTAFAASVGLLAFASRAFPTDEVATSVMLLIGLAVGVDYALFYIRREREERAKGTDPKRALEIAADTSGHTVLVSGLTVAVSMAGLGLTGLDTFTGVGVGTVLVVLVAVLGSLTVLPALLSLLGDRIELLRIPLIGRRRVSSPKSKHRHGRFGRSGRSGRGRVAARDGGESDLVDTLGGAVAAERAAQAELAARAHDLRPGLMGRLLH
nr:MMPL family transporter [Micromonospora sp. DSM 115978]